MTSKEARLMNNEEHETLKLTVEESSPQARITAGCRILYEPHTRCIMVTKSDSHTMSWGSDNKRLATFIRNAGEWEDFVMLLAEIQGLMISRIKDQYTKSGRDVFYMYEFSLLRNVH
jgi:hypothetical protein